MNETGELREWNDDRGFGFVQPKAGPRLFVHISAFERPARRPEVGDRLAFTRGPGRDGRPAVVAAIIAGATLRPPAPSLERIESAQVARASRITVAAVLLAALVLAQYLGRAPSWLLAVYLIVGAISAMAYGLDKAAAQAGRWRVSEGRLHGIDLLCGIIGGLLAQAALHHKTAKPDFAFGTWGIALVHGAGLAALIAGIFDLPPSL